MRFHVTETALARKTRASQLQISVDTWINGLVEGHVNRLKFIKRMMYGRANFDMLRKRVLLQD